MIFFAETTVVHEKIYVEKKEESVASPLQKKVPEPEKLEQTIDEKNRRVMIGLSQKKLRQPFLTQQYKG